MALIISIIVIAIIIFLMIADDNKVSNYISEKGDSHVSTKREYFDWTFFVSKTRRAYKVTYNDKHKNLRACLFDIRL